EARRPGRPGPLRGGPAVPKPSSTGLARGLPPRGTVSEAVGYPRSPGAAVLRFCTHPEAAHRLPPAHPRDPGAAGAAERPDTPAASRSTQEWGTTPPWGRGGRLGPACPPRPPAAGGTAAGQRTARHRPPPSALETPTGQGALTGTRAAGRDRSMDQRKAGASRVGQAERCST